MSKFQLIISDDNRSIIHSAVQWYALKSLRTIGNASQKILSLRMPCEVNLVATMYVQGGRNWNIKNFRKSFASERKRLRITVSKAVLLTYSAVSAKASPPDFYSPRVVGGWSQKFIENWHGIQHGVFVQNVRIWYLVTRALVLLCV